MKDIANPVSIGSDAGDVARGTKGTNEEWTILITLEFSGELININVTVGIFADCHHIGDGLTPGKFIAVVFVRPDEHHRPLVERNVLQQPITRIEISRNSQIHNGDQAINCRSRTRSTKDHAGVLITVDRPMNNPAGILT